jgi:hypothetical protein
MAIPLTNAKLSEMGPDCDKGVLPLSDTTLKRRAGDFTGNSSISTADLRGAILDVMPLEREFGPGAVSARDKSHWKKYDPTGSINPGYSVTQSSSGPYYTYFRHTGGGGDAGLTVQNYGLLPSSGQFQAVYTGMSDPGRHGFWQLEVVGSKTSWLKGGNKLYWYTIPGTANSKITSPILDIDPSYLYLTITALQGLNRGDYTRSGEIKGMRAYLV